MQNFNIPYKTGIFIVAAAFVSQQTSEANIRKGKVRPNIVYIMSDDHSMQTIGAYGYGLINTPNIDSIASNGVLFRNNFVTNSISGPCRATVLTGKFSHKNGFYDNQPHTVFDETQQTFPKLLQAEGYNTAIVGKWHLGSEPTGFDYYCIHEGQGTYYSPIMIEPDGKHVYQGEYSTYLTLEKSIGWLDSLSRDKPFCLMMHFKAPHRNWMPATDKLSLYEDTVFTIPSTFYDDYNGRQAAKEQRMSIMNDMKLGADLKMTDISGINPKKKKNNSEFQRMTAEQKDKFVSLYNPIYQDLKERNPQGKELAEWKYQRYMRDYCKVISSVDDMVGKMIHYLKENGLLENTIIIYTSDQGFYMGEHGWFDKRFMYEESLHTPFIISYPSEIKSPGIELNCLTQNIDVAPTLLDFAGIDIPDDIQGVSLKPLLTGKKKKVRDAIYYHYYEYPLPHNVKKHYGVRDDRYKLIHFYDDIDRWEFYDLKNDPCELHNVINDPRYKKRKTIMMHKLKKLQKEYEDNTI